MVIAGALALATAAFTFQPQIDWKISGPYGGTATTITVDPQAPKTLLAGALDALLYKSEDYGQNWSPLNFPPRHLGEVTAALIDPADPNHYLAGVVDAFGGGLFDSRDRGLSWTINQDIRDFGVRALTVAPSNSAEFVAGTLHGVMLSSDSGKTWKRISDPNNLEMQGITSLAIDPKNPAIIYAGTSHLPWKTSDGGKTWQSIHDGMIDDSDVFSIYVNPSNSNYIYASACSGIYTSENAGDLWKKIAGIPNTSRRTHVIRLDPTQGDTIYAGTTGGLFKSPNNGTTWRPLGTTQVNSMVFDPAEPRTMYVAMLHEGLGKSQDGGQTIQPINDGFVDRYINAMTQSGNQLVAIEEQEGDTTGIFTSADQGGTWTQIRNGRGLQGVHLRTIAGGFTNDHTLLAANARELFKSDDRAFSWKPVVLKVTYPPPAPPTPPVSTLNRAKRPASGPVRTAKARPGVKARPAVKPRPIIRTLTPTDITGIWSLRESDKDAVYLGTNNGMFKSVDWGNSWTPVDLPGSVVPLAIYSSNEPAAPFILKTSGGFLVSRDNGNKWDSLNFPLPAGDVNSIALTSTASRMLAATRVGLFTSTDGGLNWTAGANSLPASTVTAVVFANDQIAYLSEYGQLYRSDDSGQHWHLLETHLPQLQIRQLLCPAKNRLYALCPGMGVLFRENS
jgi:photosystem II stability/assembly factor-like uncharacterized protein